MKSMLLAATLSIAGLSLAAGQAEAKPAGCSLVIAQREVFSGTCDFRSHNDGTGSFVITSPSGYFVYVNIFDTPGEASGYWNGYERASHAHEDLGTLQREAADGACWSNGYARVCAR